MTGRIRAVLFDLDGTLVDSNDWHVRAWDQAFRAAGHAFNAQTIHDQIGKGTDNLVPTLLPDVDDAAIEALGEAHGTAFKGQYLDGIAAFRDARALLQRVHDAGAKIVLASSASQAELDHYIDLLDARDLVDAGTSSDDVEHTKPAPDIFTTALGKLDGIAAADTVVVGDTPYDMDAPTKCGITAIGLLSGGFPEASLRVAGAAAIYADVAALLAGYGGSPLAA